MSTLKATDEVSPKKVIMFFYGSPEEIYVICEEKENYLLYKGGEQENFTSEEILEFKILENLEQYGFSMDQLGTYLYKDVIKNIIACIISYNDPREIENLKEELSYLYSQFYLDISRFEKSIGLKTFHTCIQKAMKNVELVKNDGSMMNFDMYQTKEYGSLAFDIATDMINTFKEITSIFQISQNSKVRNLNLK